MKDVDPSIKDEKARRKVIYDLLNGARNQAKHANDGDETTFDVQQIFPLQMIMRAIPMAGSLGAKLSDEMRAMIEWMNDHPEAFE